MLPVTKNSILLEKQYNSNPSSYSGGGAWTTIAKTSKSKWHSNLVPKWYQTETLLQ